MKQDACTLMPVGKVYQQQGYTVAQIGKQYRPALKYLDAFSHVILFLEKAKGFSPLATINESFEQDELFQAVVNLFEKLSLQVVVAKIVRIDESQGIVQFPPFDIKESMVLYDIKPYFPCEDRVKEVVVPSCFNRSIEWTLDKATVELGPMVVPVRECPPNVNHQIYSAGHIHKKGGECWVHLDESDDAFYNAISLFSHIKILWWFSRFDKSTYRKVTQGKPPYENAPKTGIFATRSPVRPNPVAMTTARILAVDSGNRRIMVSHLDAFDKSPVMGILPYIPYLDRVKECSVPHWLKHWPEWLDDRRMAIGIDSTEVIVPDIVRFQKYTMQNQTRKDDQKCLWDEALPIDNHSQEIAIRGARQNNLKNISVSIPKNKITVITGVSGSGKSSLAFDTLYAESQRRFMDSLFSAGFTEKIEKPDIDQIEGLPPAIAIEQKGGGRNPRSTVGTMTGIEDYLKLLFSKIGTRHCPECGKAVVPLKRDAIVEVLKTIKPGSCFHIRPFHQLEDIGSFNVPNEKQGWNTYEKELKACVEKALETGNGAVVVNVNDADDFVFQTKEMCYECSRIFFELTASTFSFNNPESMCPVCMGMGVKLEVDDGLIVSSPHVSLLDGASKWWGDLRKFRQKPNANWMKGEILALAEAMKVDLELPWNKLPETFRKKALYGSEGMEFTFVYENTNGRKGEIVRPVEGAVNTIKRLFKENNGETANRIAASFMREKPCDGCSGERLTPEGRLVSIAGTRYPETVSMTFQNLLTWIRDLPEKLIDTQREIALPAIKEMNSRIMNYLNVGVSYLTLSRSVPTLSGGEYQRIRLASQLGSSITNILYVLDEPSAGLHYKDNHRMIQILTRIKDRGNTVVVVEHDADFILAADYIIDIGPGAGVHGGYVIAQGTPVDIMKNPDSETGKALLGKEKSLQDVACNRKKPYGWITINGARVNNLKNVDASFPLGILTCVTGVSGSGKSSLVSKTLYPALAKYFNLSEDVPGEYDNMEGQQGVDRVISVTQQAIGRSPRSNPATYTGAFDAIRAVFAKTEEAKKRGFQSNRFSFNAKEGQCAACAGEGRRCVEMHFMPDIWVICQVCQGKRYNAETLEIKYNGKTIADVLDMNIEQALLFFSKSKKITSILQTLYDVGLGYIKLGQSALTLSGGEAQRIKLAKVLSRQNTGKTVYLLDEPTTGLHFADIRNLMHLLRRITEAGNTVLVIEHHPDVIKCADWIIDLGPEGGENGGTIVAQGTPEEIAKVEDSYTGKALRQVKVVNTLQDKDGCCMS